MPFRGEGPARDAAEVATALAPRTIARIRPAERVEIHVSQPQLDFSVVESFIVQGNGTMAPVAELSSRRWAGCLDAAILAGVFLGFLGMFRSMGGQLSFGKIDVGIYAATFFLLYGLYFSLFTLFSGVTPGMQIRGLRAAALGGDFPDTRQLAWRSFGYLLSGGTLLLGFLWALWDEEHLTWQDRISRTYVTSAQLDSTEERDAPGAGQEARSSPLDKHTVA